MRQSLRARYPWVASPLIINAPMSGFAGPALAIEVALNGGMGFIGTTPSLDQLDKDLGTASEKLPRDEKGLLQIGASLLLFAHKLDKAVEVFGKHRPTAIWLFAAKSLSDYADWTKALREASPSSEIWIQVGSVAGALEIAKTARPDVLVVQGVDAGGHGFEKGAGIISLVPETLDSLRAANLGDDMPSVVAAGGITDGRSVAAALALGVEGVVMGTRFLASEEVILHKDAQAAILAASDGGQNTVRAKVFDELKGPNMWPREYDGRSIITGSYVDHTRGMTIDDNRALHQKAIGLTDAGFGSSAGQGRATIWAGTGVGLARKVQKARNILEEVRSDAKGAMRRANGVL